MKTMQQFPQNQNLCETLSSEGGAALPTVLVDPPEADQTLAEPPPTSAVTQGAGRNLPVDGIESPTVMDFKTLEQGKRLKIETTKPRTPTGNRTYVIPPAPEKKSRWLKVLVALVTIVVASAVLFLLWGIHRAQQAQVNSLRQQLAAAKQDDGDKVVGRTSSDLPPAPTTAPTPNEPPTTEEATYIYQVQASDFALAIMKTCNPEQAEEDAIAWFKEHNDKIKNINVLQVGQSVNVPCEINQGTRNGVWKMRQKIARQRNE